MATGVPVAIALTLVSRLSGHGTDFSVQSNLLIDPSSAILITQSSPGQINQSSAGPIDQPSLILIDQSSVTSLQKTPQATRDPLPTQQDVTMDDSTDQNSSHSGLSSAEEPPITPPPASTDQEDMRATPR
jgi:hypothetical protein